MKILLSILGLLFLINVNYVYGQDSGLALKITRSGLNGLELKCDLKNVSNDTIGIDPFYINGNIFAVEKPDGSLDGIGLIACGGNRKGIDVYPDSSMTWELNLNSHYFGTSSWGIRPRKNGNYKFYWVVNDIKSEAFVYEHIREE